MFVCTLEPGAPIHLSILESDNEFIARVPVGFDDDTGCVYSTFVALAPMIGYADLPGFELVFTIIEAQPDGSHIQDWWDGADSKAVIVSKNDRGRIGSVILRSIEMLVDKAKPSLVSMTTHTANLPDKALRKFNVICKHFSQMGFVGGVTDPYNGRRAWMMHKGGEEH